MVPLRIARYTLPFNPNFTAQYAPDDPIRERPVAQAHKVAYFERVRFGARPLLRRRSANALCLFLFCHNVILMVPLRVAPCALPLNANFTAQYAANDTVRSRPVAQAHRVAYFEWVRLRVRLSLWNIVTLDVGRECFVCHFGVSRDAKHY